MKTKQKKRFGMLKASLVYFLVFAIIGILAMRRLNDFLIQYDGALPSNTLNAFINSFDEERIESIVSNFTDTLDPNIQDRETAAKEIRARFSEPLSYKKDYAHSTESVSTYYLFSGERELCRFQMVTNKTEPEFPWISKIPYIGFVSSYFSLGSYEITEGSFDFTDMLCNSSRIIAPDDWKVRFNNYTVTEKELIRDTIPYSFTDLFDGEYKFPHMVEYEVNGYVGEPEITLVRPDGSELPYSEVNDENRMDLFLYNCSEKEKTEIQSFCREVTDLWITFTSNKSGVPTSNHAALAAKIDNPDLVDKLRLTIESLTYVRSKGEEITQFETDAIDLGNDMYYVMCAYKLDTTNKTEVVTSDNTITYILTRVNGNLKVKDMRVGSKNT